MAAFPLINDCFADEYIVKLIISAFVGAYTAYYFLAARSPPTVYGHSRNLLNFLHSRVPFLNEVYSPFVFGFTGRVQTLLRPLFYRADKCKYEEEFITLTDGGELLLSWSNMESNTDNTPIVILLPGLTGCGCCDYIASLVQEINRCKYRSVVLNNRGTCRRKLKTPRTYCASHTSDVALVLDHIRARYPNAPMLAVGLSLGALQLFNYVADESVNVDKLCPLSAAICICMPWDVLQTSDKLEKSLDWLLFNYPLTQSLRRVVKRNADVLSEKFDVPRILKSRSVREFDENLTVSMFGYKSVDEYYTCASPVTKIDRVRIPVICLNAADDPFVPFGTLPREAVTAEGSRVVLVLTRHGGHIGFLAGLLPTRPSLLDRAVAQFASAIFQHPEEFSAATAMDNADTELEGPEADSSLK